MLFLEKGLQPQQQALALFLLMIFTLPGAAGAWVHGVEENVDCLNETVSSEGSPPKKRVANLWTEFTAQCRYRPIANGKEPQNPNKLVVAATFEMANTYDFAKLVIMNPTL